MSGVEDDDSERFSLRWNNFQNNLTTGFHDLFEEEDLVDVTLACDGQFVQAHKIVLSVCSPYFKTLFKVNPCKHPIVILKDVGHKELLAILQFMYRGEVNVRQDDLTGFLKTAEMLKIKGLTGENTEKNSPKQRPPPEERQKAPRPAPVSIEEDVPSPSPVVPYKRMRTETKARAPSPPSPDTNDDTDGVEFLEMTKPKIEPVDYAQSDDYSNEGSSKACAEESPGSVRNHMSSDPLVVQKSEPLPSSMAAIASQFHIPSMDQDTMDTNPSLSLPPLPSALLEPSVSLQTSSKERLQGPGIFAGVSGLSQESANSQDGSQDPRRPLLWHHYTRPVTKCPLCPRDFLSLKNLRVHVQNEHGDHRGPFKCNECGRWAKNKNSLRVHMYIYHKKKKAIGEESGSESAAK